MKPEFSSRPSVVASARIVCALLRCLAAVAAAVAAAIAVVLQVHSPVQLAKRSP
jgi:hypothetical protein